MLLPPSPPQAPLFAFHDSTKRVNDRVHLNARVSRYDDKVLQSLLSRLSSFLDKLILDNEVAKHRQTKILD